MDGFGTMGTRIRRKLNNNNDAKVLIVGSNSQTGVGKTTFAVQLCRFLDSTPNKWDAKEKAFLDVSEYINAHQNYPKKSALLLDEIEAGADSRRATSHENVNLSQAWATMRAKNIATVATLPSVSMLDNRMLELADYWVLVKQRGVAQPFEINVNDFNGKVQRKPLSANKNGDGEHITFPDIKEDDPAFEDKKYLDEMKDDLVAGLTHDSQMVTMSDHEKELKKAKEQAREEAKREKRNEMIREVYNSTDWSYNDLAQFDWVGVDRSYLSKIVNSA